MYISDIELCKKIKLLMLNYHILSSLIVDFSDIFSFKKTIFKILKF